MITYGLTHFYFSATFILSNVSICLPLQPLSNRLINSIAECIHAGLHFHHCWRPNPDIRRCLCTVLKQICHCQRWNIKKVPSVSLPVFLTAHCTGPLGTINQTNMFGSTYVYFLQCFPRHSIPQNITNALHSFHQFLYNCTNSHLKHPKVSLTWT